MSVHRASRLEANCSCIMALTQSSKDVHNAKDTWHWEYVARPKRSCIGFMS